MKKIKSDELFKLVLERRKDNPNTDKIHSVNGLPIIKVLKVKDEISSKLTLETDDDVFEAIAQYGREKARKKDFFRIGMLSMLRETIKNRKKQEKK